MCVFFVNGKALMIDLGFDSSWILILERLDWSFYICATLT